MASFSVPSCTTKCWITDRWISLAHSEEISLNSRLLAAAAADNVNKYVQSNDKTALNANKMLTQCLSQLQYATQSLVHQQTSEYSTLLTTTESMHILLLSIHSHTFSQQWLEVTNGSCSIQHQSSSTRSPEASTASIHRGPGFNNNFGWNQHWLSPNILDSWTYCFTQFSLSRALYFHSVWLPSIVMTGAQQWFGANILAPSIFGVIDTTGRPISTEHVTVTSSQGSPELRSASCHWRPAGRGSTWTSADTPDWARAGSTSSSAGAERVQSPADGTTWSATEVSGSESPERAESAAGLRLKPDLNRQRSKNVTRDCTDQFSKNNLMK